MDTCWTHGKHMLLCNTSLITHVEHSGTAYIRIPWNASLLTHVLQLVYIVSSLNCNLSCILLKSPPNQCVTLISILSHSIPLLFDSMCEPTMLVLWSLLSVPGFGVALTKPSASLTKMPAIGFIWPNARSLKLTTEQGRHFQY